MISFNHYYGYRVRRAHFGEKCGFEDAHRNLLVNKWSYFLPDIFSQTKEA